MNRFDKTRKSENDQPLLRNLNLILFAMSIKSMISLLIER